MTAERDSMTLNEVSVPALGVEERSDEAPRSGRARPTPDPEVVAKPKRRQFTAEYRLRILVPAAFASILRPLLEMEADATAAKLEVARYVNVSPSGSIRSIGPNSLPRLTKPNSGPHKMEPERIPTFAGCMTTDRAAAA